MKNSRLSLRGKLNFLKNISGLSKFPQFATEAAIGYDTKIVAKKTEASKKVSVFFSNGRNYFVMTFAISRTLLE